MTEQAGESALIPQIRYWPSDRVLKVASVLAGYRPLVLAAMALFHERGDHDHADQLAAEVKQRFGVSV